MANPRILVVIPAYNEEKYLPAAIESVLISKKEYPYASITVVANGCTDSTASVAGRYSKKGVRLIETGRRSIPHAKNIGAKSQDYDILVFLDADTLVSKRMLASIARALRTHDFGSAWVRPRPANFRSRLFMAIKNMAFCLGLYKGTNGIIFCKRKLFEKAGGFDESLIKAEDRRFVYSALRHGKYTFLKSAYVSTSMRRFEKAGYFTVPFYWIRQWLLEKTGRKNGDYPAYR